MTDRPDIYVAIDALRIAGLSPPEAARLETALASELEQRLARSGVDAKRGPITLPDMRIALAQRGEPEAMGAQIGAQIASALTGNAGAGLQARAGRMGEKRS
ncbi:MAG: hypothetical protein AAFY47_08645 [Pseudomonadota bacterium]